MTTIICPDDDHDASELHAVRCCLSSEKNEGPCTDAGETEQVEGGNNSNLVSTTSTRLCEELSHVDEVNNDAPGASQHHLCNEQVSASTFFK